MTADLRTTKTILKQSIPQFKNEYHLRRVGVFGSVARGDATQTSDVDIPIELNEPISLFKLIELEELLEQLLKREVDVVTVNAFKPLLRERILRETVYV